MKSILLIALAAQLPLASNPSNPYGLPYSPAGNPASGPSEVQLRNNEDALRQLFATTKSVMKRHGDTSPADGFTTPPADGFTPPAPASAATIRDEQLVQASHKQSQTGTANGQVDPNDPAGAGSAPTGSGNDKDPTRSAASIDAAARAAANASADLLASALAPRAVGALDGRPVSLADAIGRGPTSARRLEVAALYWKLVLAIADYHWALDESEQLAIPIKKDSVDAPLLSAAQAAAHARSLEAKASAVSLQQELADAIGQPTQPLPLTVDQPLVGPYRTEFDSIFAGRAAPGRSRAIHRALPHLREAIDVRTAAVQAATSAVPAAEAAFGEQNSGIATVLYAHGDLRAQRRAFLNAVREYNAEIVEYASYVAGPSTSTATLVAMLTRSKPNKLSTNDGATSTFGGLNEPTVAPSPPQFDSNVRPASGEEQLDDNKARGAGWTGATGANGDLQSGSSTPTQPETNLKQIEEGQE